MGSGKDEHVDESTTQMRQPFASNLVPTETSSLAGIQKCALPTDRIINLVVGGLTTLLLVVTLISAFVFPQLPPKPVNVFFAFCISLCCISAGILIYWYRQGDLEPKFRNLIYYILFSIVMLCICANLYFHEVDK
ncbi:transmembrane protein 243 [Empidonax traillii]|uniref:transmembrane protein 243 n=1 Tax=Empidonax traillii TaxID=164674 RepID=UPI000FFD0A31|nr:transmembrane protein 243 [Empidonax traillii]